MGKAIQVDREILFFAFRYALGRKSYAPLVIENNIKANIENIDINEIKAFIREIAECEDYGMDMDKQHWTSFKAYLENVLVEREAEK